MAASLTFAPISHIPCFAALVLVILILQQARFMALAVAWTKTNSLTVGDILTPPNYILSPSGDFAFGFLRVRAHDSDPAIFILATWCRVDGDNSSSQPQPQSVVWFAKESSMGATANATARSVLYIQTPDGQLTLTDGSGGQELWKTMASRGKRGRVVVLRDSGNVQFLGDGDDEVLWESFAYPTDTLLPGQSLQGALFSKRSDAEFATGRFSLAAQNDGNVVLCVDLFTGDIKQNAYWATGTNGPDSNTTITFDHQGYLNYTLYGGEEVYTLISPTVPLSIHHQNILHQLARIDPDGVVRTYVGSRTGTRNRKGGNTSSWTVSGTLRSGGCSMKTDRLQGMCGPGSYCVETVERLDCLCPPGYTYIDAQHRDSGCTPEFEPQSCGGGGSEKTSSDSDEFSLVELPNTTWEISIYYKKFPSVTEKQCQDLCLSDCYCTAAVMINGSDCAEVGALTYGRQGNDILTTALIKVRNGTSSSRTPYTERPSSAAAGTRTTRRPYPYYMIIVVVCLASLLLVTVGVLLSQYYYRARNRASRLQCSSYSYSVKAFSWKELHQATNGFKELLGRGSFGEVYKGTLTSPQMTLIPIAVKKLIDSNDYSEQEFTNEVQSVGRIHHRNLVRMMGYCKQGKHRILVFEFMPGGSLRGLLFQQPADGSLRRRPPPWQWRAEAALAIARGLEYLHDGCAVPIIHCDIKPDNILLDGHGVPRITDFGISKLLGSQQVRTTVTHVRGTRGYIAPEWLRGDARVDTKVDVYSFGVVLLELISCRRCQDPVVNYLPPGAQDNNDDDDDETTVTLFGWAAQLVVARKTELMLHGHGDAAQDVVATAEAKEQVELFARVALWCVEPNPLLRPTMHQVVQLLESSDWAQVHALPAPAKCYLESSPLIPQLNSVRE